MPPRAAGSSLPGRRPPFTTRRYTDLVSPATSTRKRQRTAAGLALSLLVHASAALWLSRDIPLSVPPAPPTVELEILSPPSPPPPPPPPEPAPEPEPAPAPRPPSPRRPARNPAAPVTPSAPPSPAPTTPTASDDSLLRMRGGPGAISLLPDDATLERALGPVEAPAPGPTAERPAPRKRRLPGTGLTTLPAPPIDEKVRQIHPRFFEVLAGVERKFRPDPRKVADEVRGDLAPGVSIKRWLFGGMAGDVEALRNQVPTLACLVCVTLRPHQAPEIELAGASGSAWFDRSATELVERAAVPKDEREEFDPGRACYRFAAKVWRARPDLTNLSIPFKLIFHSDVRLVSHQKLAE